MDDAVANARMSEFIEAKGLTREYEAYVAKYEADRRSVSEPSVTVQYDKHYSRRSRDEYMNLTPWMRQASTEEMLRLARLSAVEDGERSAEDKQFLLQVIEHFADEEEQEWLSRASEVTVWLYQLNADLSPHLAGIRPDDHAVIQEALTRAEETMHGDRDVMQAA